MQLGHKNTDLDRYIYLTNLLDHNETFFYRTLNRTSFCGTGDRALKPRGQIRKPLR